MRTQKQSAPGKPTRTWTFVRGNKSQKHERKSRRTFEKRNIGVPNKEVRN